MAMESLEKGGHDDWIFPMQVMLIEEDRIDAGGISRKFFFSALKCNACF